MNNNETNPLDKNGQPQYLIIDMEMVRGFPDAVKAFQELCYEDAVLNESETNQLLRQSQSLPAVEQPEKSLQECKSYQEILDSISLTKHNQKFVGSFFLHKEYTEAAELYASQFKQPSQPESLTKMLSIAPPEKWLNVYEHYQELLNKEDFSGFWQDSFHLADKERNEVKDISNDLAESYAKLQIEYGKKCAELNELKIDGHESKTLEDIKQFISDWMSGYEPDTFIANKHGNYIYSNGPSSLNLKILFEDLLVYYIDANQPRKDDLIQLLKDAYSLIPDSTESDLLPAIKAVVLSLKK